MVLLGSWVGAEQPQPWNVTHERKEFQTDGATISPRTSEDAPDQPYGVATSNEGA